MNNNQVNQPAGAGNARGQGQAAGAAPAAPAAGGAQGAPAPPANRGRAANVPRAAGGRPAAAAPGAAQPQQAQPQGRVVGNPVVCRNWAQGRQCLRADCRFAHPAMPDREPAGQPLQLSGHLNGEQQRVIAAEFYGVITAMGGVICEHPLARAARDAVTTIVLGMYGDKINRHEFIELQGRFRGGAPHDTCRLPFEAGDLHQDVQVCPNQPCVHQAGLARGQYSTAFMLDVPIGVNDVLALFERYMQLGELILAVHLYNDVRGTAFEQTFYWEACAAPAVGSIGQFVISCPGAATIREPDLYYLRAQAQHHGVRAELVRTFPGSQYAIVRLTRCPQMANEVGAPGERAIVSRETGPGAYHFGHGRLFKFSTTFGVYEDGGAKHAIRLDEAAATYNRVAAMAPGETVTNVLAAWLTRQVTFKTTPAVLMAVVGDMKRKTEAVLAYHHYQPAKSGWFAWARQNRVAVDAQTAYLRTGQAGFWETTSVRGPALLLLAVVLTLVAFTIMPVPIVDLVPYTDGAWMPVFVKGEKLALTIGLGVVAIVGAARGVMLTLALLSLIGSALGYADHTTTLCGDALECASLTLWAATRGALVVVFLLWVWVKVTRKWYALPIAWLAGNATILALMYAGSTLTMCSGRLALDHEGNPCPPMRAAVEFDLAYGPAAFQLELGKLLASQWAVAFFGPTMWLWARAVGPHWPGRLRAEVAFFMAPFVMLLIGAARLDALSIVSLGLAWAVAAIVCAVAFTRSTGFAFTLMVLIMGANAGVAPAAHDAATNRLVGSQVVQQPWMTMSEGIAIATVVMLCYLFCCRRRHKVCVSDFVLAAYKADRFSPVDLTGPLHVTSDGYFGLPCYVVSNDMVSACAGIDPTTTVRRLAQDDYEPTHNNVFAFGLVTGAALPSVSASCEKNEYVASAARQCQFIEEWRGAFDVVAGKAMKFIDDAVSNSENYEEFTDKVSGYGRVSFEQDYANWNARFPATRRAEHDQALARIIGAETPYVNFRELFTRQAFVKREMIMKQQEYEPRLIIGASDALSVLTGPTIHRWSTAIKLVTRPFQNGRVAPLAFMCGVTAHELGGWLVEAIRAVGPTQPIYVAVCGDDMLVVAHSPGCGPVIIEIDGSRHDAHMHAGFNAFKWAVYEQLFVVQGAATTSEPADAPGAGCTTCWAAGMTHQERTVFERMIRRLAGGAHGGLLPYVENIDAGMRWFGEACNGRENAMFDSWKQPAGQTYHCHDAGRAGAGAVPHPFIEAGLLESAGKIVQWVTPHGVWGATLSRTWSGAADTWLGNSFQATLVAHAAGVCATQANWAGNEGGLAENITRKAASIGYDAKVKIHQYLSDVTFLSGCFLTVDGQPTWVPKIGRLICRLGWTINPKPGRRNLKNRWLDLASKVTCFWPYSYLPFLGDYLRQVRSLIPVEYRYHLDEEHCKRQVLPHTGFAATRPEDVKPLFKGTPPDAWAFITRRYGLTAGDQQQFQVALSKVDSLPFIISHPVLDALTAVDVF